MEDRTAEETSAAKDETMEDDYSREDGRNVVGDLDGNDGGDLDRNDGGQDDGDVEGREDGGEGNGGGKHGGGDDYVEEAGRNNELGVYGGGMTADETEEKVKTEGEIKVETTEGGMKWD
jgi:hypothetical protein